ncbi:MAG: GMC family oxidoreductase [Sphingobacteriales bacterium]|nr:MAG: GMC family oxidoreductase [Sphingobacteriales bacterium]
MQQFDAIVIGSGITGGWAAKELTEKGLRTLMIERGRDVEHIKDYTTATKNPWDLTHRDNRSITDKETYPIQTRHYSIKEDNKHFYILDKQNPYTEVQRYDWVRADVLGGRSLLWARMCFRWSDLDFEANAKDGHGVDWPIRYQDIAPWYDYVEKFVGISGKKEGIPHLPDSLFQAPMPLNCVEADIKNKIESKYSDRTLIHGRTANLTQQLPGRGACQYRNLCHRGCPYGAYFSTQSSTLPAAMATGKLTVKTGLIVNRIIYDEAKQKATGVEVIDRETNKTYIFEANLIFINASTVATTFLLLNSTSNRFPNGLGNDHDMVGRHLMDHHKSRGMSGEVVGFRDKYYYGRRPTGVYIPRFVNVNAQKEKFLRGYGIQGGAYRGREKGEGIGAAFKEAITEAGGWTVGFTAFGECLPYAENRITLNTDKKDHWGRPTLNIDASFKENEKAMQKDYEEKAAEMFESIGIQNIRFNGSMSFPGNANHEMGTARMGKDPKTSVLNKWNQMHTVKNVFITDGSSMASSSCVNPSLTYMALTARAVDYAVAELKKRNF